VGDTIEEFASDDATVVVGTVIDPSMGEEIRVTVVATGLGERAVVKEVKPVEPPKAVVTDYRQLDRPAALRSRTASSASSHTMPQSSGLAKAAGAETDMDYLDIPAFLRRQAD